MIAASAAFLLIVVTTTFWFLRQSPGPDEAVEERSLIAVMPFSIQGDPELQYLETGKVPGAKTIADVRKHYEALVPMGRGCEVEDVYKALRYIVDQKYETGQAVPVTGGQVMLH